MYKYINIHILHLMTDTIIIGCHLHTPPIQTDGHFRPLITINGQMPGPTIITVYNELKNVEGISIHWHGMHQRDRQ